MVTKNGKEIEENLSNVNIGPEFYVYESYIKNESKKECPNDKNVIIKINLSK